MATRFIDRKAGTGLMEIALPGAVGIQYDSDDDLLKFADDDGSTIRKVVTEDQIQTLTNKTLTGAVLTPATVEYSANGAIALPTSMLTVVNLTKAGVAAMTLADPTAAIEGAIMVINTETAQAHTVTNTTGFNGAGAGGDVATWGGAIGDGMVLVALNAKWNVVVLKNVTLG